MELSGEYLLSASRDKVWAALNDPDILRRSLPGCETLEKIGDSEFRAVSMAKVGPVKARFEGRLMLTQADPPRSYTIEGEGKGGAAGFARGRAFVELMAEGAATRLTYRVEANVGGKLAQIGQRLVDGAARKLSDDFFVSFASLVSESPVEQPTPSPPSTAQRPRVLFRAAILAIGACLMGVGLWNALR